MGNWMAHIYRIAPTTMRIPTTTAHAKLAKEMIPMIEDLFGLPQVH